MNIQAIAPLPAENLSELNVRVATLIGRYRMAAQLARCFEFKPDRQLHYRVQAAGAKLNLDRLLAEFPELQAWRQLDW